MKAAEDQWLTVRHMQEGAQRRRSQHNAIVELRDLPVHTASSSHDYPVQQPMQRQDGRTTVKKAQTAQV